MPHKLSIENNNVVTRQLYIYNKIYKIFKQMKNIHKTILFDT